MEGNAGGAFPYALYFEMSRW